MVPVEFDPRGDEGRQKAVPERRAGDRHRPFHVRKVAGEPTRQEIQLVRRLRKQEEQRDRCADCERAPLRRRPRGHPICEQTHDRKVDEDDPQAVDVDQHSQSSRVRGQEQRVCRTRRAACRQRADRRDLRCEERETEVRNRDEDHTRHKDRDVDTAQPSGRKREDDRERGDEVDRLPFHAERECARAARRLQDVDRIEKAENDEHQPEAALRPLVTPVQADADRPDDQVDLLKREPARIREEVRVRSDDRRSHRGTDADRGDDSIRDHRSAAQG